MLGWMSALAVAAVMLVAPAVRAADDGQAKLGAIAKAMGADQLKSIQFSISGEGNSEGQPAYPGGSYPRYILKSMTRTINYRTGAVRDEIVRANGENPPRGGGGIPLQGDQRVTFSAAGSASWNTVGQNDIPAPELAAERLIQAWLSPHGAIKGALANRGRVASRTIDGQKMSVISYGQPGKYKIEAYANDANMIERVVGWTSNAVLGETKFEARYTEYRDFGSIKFPATLRVIQSGHPIIEANVDDVRANVPAEITPPDSVKMVQERVVTANTADGVWYVTGGSHHSVVIEMKDYLIVVESPLYDERAAAVLAEAKKLVPKKPVRYVIVTHDHFDHAGGARYAAAHGITVIAHDDARDFFARNFARPSPYNPDALAKAKQKPKLDGVAEKRVISDGKRIVELHHIRGNPHSSALIMVYLPKEKVLIEADAFTPGAPNAPYPQAVNPSIQNLYDNIERLGLQVETILPIHGRMVPFEELKRAVGRAG